MQNAKTVTYSLLFLFILSYELCSCFDSECQRKARFPLVPHLPRLVVWEWRTAIVHTHRKTDHTQIYIWIYIKLKRKQNRRENTRARVWIVIRDGVFSITTSSSCSNFCSSSAVVSVSASSSASISRFSPDTFIINIVLCLCAASFSAYSFTFTQQCSTPTSPQSLFDQQ